MANRHRPPDGSTVGALVDDHGRVVCEHCEVADRMIPRLRGLLGRKEIAPGVGLWITRTSSIHTFLMAFPIDAVFLDRHRCVRSIVADVKPARVVWRPGSRSVLELRAGEAARVGIELGSRLSWHDPGR